MDGKIEKTAGSKEDLPLYGVQLNAATEEYEVSSTDWGLIQADAYIVTVMVELTPCNQATCQFEVDTFKIYMRHPCEQSAIWKFTIPTTPMTTRVTENNIVTE